MPLLEHRFTADDIRAFPDDGNRYETVHGELLVTPAPGGRHQLVLERLAGELRDYLIRHGREELLRSPADISWDDHTLVQPDLFVGDFDRFMQTFAWADIQTLYLVVEVLSPGSRRADRVVKRRLYQEQRIAEYWIVDIERRCIDIWTPDATEARSMEDRITWQHPLVAAACEINVGVVFRGV